jgi:inositol-phosphate phosphatase/L-galactose 1-phosphate phosphatase/histidinol-phosphatase
VTAARAAVPFPRSPSRKADPMFPTLAPPAGFDATPDGLMAFAHHLANSVRPLARRHFRTPLAVEAKADASPVTEADRSIEARKRAEIRQAYPGHGILGEEEGGDFAHDLTWVVDPIDGTQSFITGMPLFGTLIALVRGGRPILGLIDMPALAERWHGNGSSAWFGGKPIRTSRRALAEARLFATSPDLFKGADAEAFAALSAAVGLRRFGGDCYAYGLLASGHCDLVVEAGLKVYDVMALAPVVEGAGGVMTDWAGRPLTPDFDGRVIAAANPELHAAALRQLTGFA